MNKSNKKSKISTEDGVEFMSIINLSLLEKEKILSLIKDELNMAYTETVEFNIIKQAVGSGRIKRTKYKVVFTFTEAEKEVFVNQLEDAVSAFIFDLDISKKRATPTQAVERLCRVTQKAMELSQFLKETDSITETSIRKRGVKLIEITQLLDDLTYKVESYIYDDIRKSKPLYTTINPYRIFSANIIKVFQNFGLLEGINTQQKKIDVVEKTMRELIKVWQVQKGLVKLEEKSAKSKYLRDFIDNELKDSNPAI
jgi:hypothetical protein